MDTHPCPGYGTTPHPLIPDASFQQISTGGYDSHALSKAPASEAKPNVGVEAAVDTLPVAPEPQATPFVDKLEFPTQSTGNLVILSEDARTLEYQVANLEKELSRGNKAFIELSEKYHAADKERDSLSEQLAQAHRLIEEYKTQTGCPICRKSETTPPSPTLYCQKCGNEPGFNTTRISTKVKLDWFCRYCHATRTFGPEKPDTKHL